MARMFTFWVSGCLPARNESELSARACWQAGSSLKKKHTRRVELAALAARDVAWVPMSRYEVRVEYRCKDRRKDPDNICGGIKYILDGLVAAGVVQGDRWSNVVQLYQTWVVDRDRPGVEVELTEVM